MNQCQRDYVTPASVVTLLKLDGETLAAISVMQNANPGQENTSNLKKHLIKHKIYLKGEEYTMFDSLKARFLMAAAANVSMMCSFMES